MGGEGGGGRGERDMLGRRRGAESESGRAFRARSPGLASPWANFPAKLRVEAKTKGKGAGKRKRGGWKKGGASVLPLLSSVPLRLSASGVVLAEQ